jgi:hypothetical protein
LVGIGLAVGGASLTAGAGVAAAATGAAVAPTCSEASAFSGATESVSVTTPKGVTTYYPSLQVAASSIVGGDTVSVTYSGANASASCPVGLASYRDVYPYFDQYTTEYLYDSASSKRDAATLTVKVPMTVGTSGCTIQQPSYPVNGHGANTSGSPDNGFYNPTCSEPGAHGHEPATGSVGKADAKNPPGQDPTGRHNAGYECNRNQGIGQGNPAHTSCSYGGWQVDFFVGPVLDTVGPVSTNPAGFYSFDQTVHRLIDYANG